MNEIFTGSPIKDVDIRLDESAIYQKTDIMQLLTDVLAQYEVSQKTYELAVTDQRKDERILQTFLASKQINGLSKRTLDYYKSELCLWKKFLGNRSFLEINQNDIRLYLARCEYQNGNGKVTLNGKRRTLSTFYHWLRDEEYISRCDIDRISKIKEDKKIKKPFTSQELERLRDYAKSSAKSEMQKARNLALLEVLLSTAARVGEIAGMKKNDVDFTGKRITVFGKGAKERKTFLSDVAEMRLKNYLALRTDDNPYLFVTLDRPYERLKISGIEIFIRELGRAAGVEKTHPHRFRRTAATNALNKGMPIDLVKEMLGHEKIDTTLIYAKQSDGNLDAALRKYVN